MTFSEQQLGSLQRALSQAETLAEGPGISSQTQHPAPSTMSIGPQGSQAPSSAMITATRDTRSFTIRLIVTPPSVHQAAGLVSQGLRVQMPEAAERRCPGQLCLLN